MSIGCSNIPPVTPYITPEYLSELHSMSMEEATLYCTFCNKHTIYWKECYGNGQIMLPLWRTLNNEASQEIAKLLNP